MSFGTQKLFKQDQLGLFQESRVINHVELAEELVTTKEKSLAQKNSGKFYTPEEIALPLIDQALAVLKLELRTGTIKIIDPFCGDGRLIKWLLPKIKNSPLKFELHIWDYDENALLLARTRIQKEIDTLKIKGRVFSKKTDSFGEFFANWENNFDLVITNPPWEIIKPDPKDTALISDKTKREKYVASLKEFSNRLLRDFPLSRPEKAYGGWGVNLARVGTELSVRLAKEKGVVAIVTPSTIFADQNSLRLRKWIFAENNLRHLNVYPAELRLFVGVDQPSVSFVLERNGLQQSLSISNYNNLSSPIALEIKDINALLLSTDHVLPVSAVVNMAHVDILSSFSDLPKLNELENIAGLWLGRELDETNYKTWLSINGKIRFIKGRDVERFNLNNNPKFFINESTLKVRIPISTEYHKIVWRDISRPNQKRRVIATMVPPGYVAGNSLGVLYVKTGNRKVLTGLLGLLSSFVFEFQLRAYLATAHVSAGVMRKIRIPNWNDDLVTSLSDLVDKRIAGDIDSEVRLEIQVAKHYGLKRFEFEKILEAFPKLSSEETNKLLDVNTWNT